MIDICIIDNRSSSNRDSYDLTVNQRRKHPYVSSNQSSSTLPWH